MWIEAHERIIRQAGGRYEGTAEGLVYFYAPSGWLMSLRSDELIESVVRARLALDASETWGKDGREKSISPGRREHEQAERVRKLE
jgi:hypothetical protein